MSDSRDDGRALAAREDPSPESDPGVASFGLGYAVRGRSEAES